MIQIKVVEIEGDEYIVGVTSENFRIIKLLLENERKKIINRLKTYKLSGLINSIKYPRNKNMQNVLDDLVKRKRTITKSMEQINRIFLR